MNQKCQRDTFSFFPADSRIVHRFHVFDQVHCGLWFLGQIRCAQLWIFLSQKLFLFCALYQKEKTSGSTGFNVENTSDCLPVTQINQTDFNNHLICVRHCGGPSEYNYQ